MTLGEKISQARRAKSLSQEDLAEAAKVSSRTIQRIENNVSTPRAFTLKQIALALDLSIDTLTAPLPQNTNSIANPWSYIRLINASALGVVLVPLSNVLLPLWLWKRNKQLPQVDTLGRQIISFQVLWTIATLLCLIGYPMLSMAFTGSVANGNFPWSLLIYVTAVMLNIIFTLHTSQRIQTKKDSIYPFIPALL
ncbi:hypothetical protein BKI52_13580 [marine bacterium AO1-C]|nr:hypothetical protein BKI52_13580 [marine bacterium AO1-C]